MQAESPILGVEKKKSDGANADRDEILDFLEDEQVDLKSVTQATILNEEGRELEQTQ